MKTIDLFGSVENSSECENDRSRRPYVPFASQGSYRSRILPRREFLESKIPKYTRFPLRTDSGREHEFRTRAFEDLESETDAITNRKLN